MRFLLEFVACCGHMNMSSTGVSTEVELPRSEETRSLVPSMVRKQRRRKWGSLSSSSAGEVEWKPSLYAISEDKAVVMMRKEEDDNRTVGSERVVKMKSGSRGPKIQFRTHRDDYGQGPVPLVIPAFSPTPFLF